MPSPFDSSGVQTAFDSTSLGWLKTCAQLWKYQMIDGYQAKEDRLHLDYGIWYHSALEHYYKHRHAGVGHMDALRLVVREALTSTWIDGKAWAPEHTKNRLTLIRTIIWYLDEFGLTDNAKTLVLPDGRLAVELSFSFSIDHGYFLSGHMDRIVELLGQPYVMDHKTTTMTPGPYYFDQYSPDNQVSLYSLAAQVAYSTTVKGVIIDAAQVAVGFSRFERGFAPRSTPVLEEWLDDFYLWAELGRLFVERNHFPKNDKHCFRCHFRDVCRSAPKIRQTLLNDSTKFEKRHWNPLEPR